jgi:hypothetical protein
MHESDGGGGPWGTLIGVVGAGVVLLGGVLFVLRGSQTTESRGDKKSPSIPALAGSIEIPALPRISQVTAAVLLTSAKGIARVFDDLGTVVGGVLRVLGNGAGPALGMFARGLASIPVAIVSGIAAPLAALGSVGSGASSFVSDGLSKASSIRSDTPATDARATAAPETEADEGPDPVESVAEAWHRMVERVSVRNPVATTPVEYADAAIERGLPSGPVRRLTDLYRRIRYGPETESSPHLEQARDALERIRGGDD